MFVLIYEVKERLTIQFNISTVPTETFSVASDAFMLQTINPDV